MGHCVMQCPFLFLARLGNACNRDKKMGLPSQKPHPTVIKTLISKYYCFTKRNYVVAIDSLVNPV